jgi:hypothetical protein
MAGLSSPSLHYFGIRFSDEIWPFSVHLTRFINEMEERYHAVHVYFGGRGFRILLLTQSECINQHPPSVRLGPFMRRSPESIMRMSSALSMKFTTVEELRIGFDITDEHLSENFVAWRRFLQQFRNVKTIQTEGADNYSMARILHQDHGKPDELSFLPVLEEIDLGQQPFEESQRGAELAAFEPFVSARQQAGRPVKVFFGW